MTVVAQPDVAAVGPEAVVGLDGELPRRGQNQRPHRVARRGEAGVGVRRRRWSIGSAKAAVLPVPVWARPITSRPADKRDRLFLDGRGYLIALLDDCAQDSGLSPKWSKVKRWFPLLDLSMQYESGSRMRPL